MNVRLTFLQRGFLHCLITLCIVLGLVLFAGFTWAQQYKSRELAPTQSLQESKSIAELEQEIHQGRINNDYARQSTARYLARYYLNDKSKGSAEKSLKFYQESLQGEGLSDFAKQEVWLEIISLQYKLNRYQDVIESMKAYQAIGGKISVDLLLLEAEAHLALKKYSASVKLADKAWRSFDKSKKSGRLSDENLSELDLLLQLRFLYYKSLNYKRAVDAQKTIVDQYDQSDAAIRLLANLYLKQKQYKLAADTLHLAYVQGYPFSEAQVIQLSAIYAKTDNPFTSAKILDDAMQKQVVAKTIKNYRQLMYYWLQAKELGHASTSLEVILELEGSSSDYLLLAELKQRQSDWLSMKQSVESACELSLDDADIGRANVLLGIAELKLENFEHARRAFINATLQGGEIDRANQYLEFMQAKDIGQNELGNDLDNDLGNYKGVCTPEWARASDFSLAAPSHNSLAEGDGFFSEEIATFNEAKRVSYLIETSAEKNLVGSFHTLPVNAVEHEILPLAIRLGLFIGKNGGQISGDLHFIFPEPFKVGQEFMSFTMAFPVRRKPMIKGQYQLIKDVDFFSASAIFEGHPKDLISFWADFYSTVLADDLNLTGVSRQVVLEPRNASKEYLKMKLQLEVVQEASK